MRRVVRVLGIVLVIVLTVAIALPLLVDANQFRPLLESQLAGALGREVKLGTLKIALFSGAVAASDVSIADDPAFSKTPFLRAQSLKVGVELLPLIFSKKVNVTGIDIVQPQIDLLQARTGAWNFSSLAAGARPPHAGVPPGPATQKSIASLKI